MAWLAARPAPSVNDLMMSRLDRSTSLDPPPEKTIFRIGYRIGENLPENVHRSRFEFPIPFLIQELYHP
ncbi:hypothetical protein ANCCAN_24742 [Ancylostoma caninum]|uniref:Uncharacterized protein n=1 Tax=Ancylostoma caninum TaxID=29170 RepID=A0A368FF37_ANCCA|nr:hypothetical protein ANCCAN_24742 [Ancylostoma caninum]